MRLVKAMIAAGKTKGAHAVDALWKKALRNRQFKNLARTFGRVLRSKPAKAFGKEVAILVIGLKKHARQHIKVSDFPKKRAVPWKEDEEEDFVF